MSTPGAYRRYQIATERTWLDMSEIVRPTCDGIHGREFISTSVDLGEKPATLPLAHDGSAVGTLERSRSTSQTVLAYLQTEQAAD